VDTSALQQQGAALSLLRLVVDGNNETQQKEPGAPRRKFVWTHTYKQ
jgi:hypothetical protein